MTNNDQHPEHSDHSEQGEQTHINIGLVELDGDEAKSVDGQSIGKPGNPPVFIVYVDNTLEMDKALYFACRRCRQLKGRVALATVIEPVENTQWLKVAKMMLRDARTNAESRLHRAAAKVHQWSEGAQPLFLMGQGRPAQVLVKLVNESIQVSMLVLAASADPDSPGPIIASLAQRAPLELHKPMVIIPRAMTFDDIETLT